jgi:hypothetical protein
MRKAKKFKEVDLLLEAEVAPNQQRRFENRYLKATGQGVSPGKPSYYQSQPNKWGSELRVYFNDPGFAALVESLGVTVEQRRRGYRSGEYHFRFNDNKLWWKLVEKSGLRLGPN